VKCHESKIIIYLYLDGEASEKQQASLFNHLKECSSCRQEMQRSQSLQELLVKNCTLVEDVPPNLRDGIMATIDVLKQNPVKERPARSVIRQRRFWETKFGIGLLAGAAGLLLTYYMVASIPNTNIANKDTIPKVKASQEKEKAKAITKLAEAKGIKQEPVTPKTEPQKIALNPSIPNNTKITPPLKVAQAVPQQLTNSELIKGTVDLPKPLSISKYIYNENLASNDAPIGENMEQPLYPDFKFNGRIVSAEISNHTLQIITQSAGIAKLWQLEPTKATKATDIASKDVTGLVVNSGNKLLNIEAEKAAVSPSGTIATIATVNNELQLSIGDKSTPLAGNVISDLSWSPDGKKVLYFIQNGKFGHLESYDGVSSPVQITPAIPAQSIAWTYVNENKLILNIQTDTSGIWELRLPDGKLNPLAGVGGGSCVAINSNNDIAFTDAVGIIYVLLHDDNGTKKLVKLTEQAKAINFLTWTTDKTLLYLVSEQEQTDLWRIVLP
jgi:mycothiol system anti-sigma-R factor